MHIISGQIINKSANYISTENEIRFEFALQ